MDNFNENEKNEFENDVDNTENDNGKKTNKKWRKFKIPKEKINFKFSNYFVYIIVIAILLFFILFVTQNAKYIPIVLVIVLVTTIIALLVSGKLGFREVKARKVAIVSTFGIIDDYVIKRQMIAEGLSIDNYEEENNKSNGILSKIPWKRKPKKGIFNKYIFMFPFREILTEYSLGKETKDFKKLPITTDDGIIEIDTALTYHIINPKKRYDLESNFDETIEKSIQHSINNVIGQKEMQDVLSSKNREKISKELKQYFVENIKPDEWGIFIVQFLMDGVYLTPENQRAIQEIQSAKQQQERDIIKANTKIQVAEKEVEALRTLEVGKADVFQEQLKKLETVKMSEAAKISIAKDIYSKISENATVFATMPNFSDITSHSGSSDYLDTAVKAKIFTQVLNKEASSPKEADETSTD